MPFGMPPFAGNVREWFGLEPKLGFQSFVNQWGGSPNQASFYRSAFEDLYNRYLGQLGSQARGGEDPTLEWYDYLQGFDPLGYYYSFDPSRRGERYTQFAPWVRWLGR